MGRTHIIMMEKVKIERMKGKFYEYSISAMGREVVLLTRAEFLQLYGQMTDLIVDDDEMW